MVASSSIQLWLCNKVYMMVIPLLKTTKCNKSKNIIMFKGLMWTTQNHNKNIVDRAKVRAKLKLVAPFCRLLLNIYLHVDLSHVMVFSFYLHVFCCHGGEWELHCYPHWIFSSKIVLILAQISLVDLSFPFLATFKVQ